MLRRRRTCNPQELSHSLSDFVCDNETRKKEKQNLVREKRGNIVIM